MCFRRPDSPPNFYDMGWVETLRYSIQKININTKIKTNLETKKLIFKIFFIKI